MKINKQFRFIFLFFVFFLVILLSGCVGLEPTLIVITKVKTATQQVPSSTITAIPAADTVAPSPTDTATSLPSVTPSRTATVTATKNFTKTPTHTPEPASLILNQDTACFLDSSFASGILAYISAGQQYPILATIDDESWWFVNLGEEKTCWIFGEYSSLYGASGEVPVITPSPPPTSTATLPQSSYGIYYILIAKDTGGPFGCGDSLIYYYPGVRVNGDMEDEILAALNALFSNHNQYINGLYNPIYQSQLKAKGVEVVGGDVVVQLNGTFVRPKDKCESQRMHDQIWYTISQFSPTRAVVYLNNALLGDLLEVTNK